MVPIHLPSTMSKRRHSETEDEDGKEQVQAVIVDRQALEPEHSSTGTQHLGVEPTAFGDGTTIKSVSSGSNSDSESEEDPINAGNGKRVSAARSSVASRKATLPPPRKRRRLLSDELETSADPDEPVLRNSSPDGAPVSEHFTADFAKPAPARPLAHDPDARIAELEKEVEFLKQRNENQRSMLEENKKRFENSRDFIHERQDTIDELKKEVVAAKGQKSKASKMKDEADAKLKEADVKLKKIKRTLGEREEECARWEELVGMTLEEAEGSQD
ncbi:hypothetical protein LTR37_000380 [Vermiconidia calcicola]|uniref:Uncharacterized protein n=1 Tax=Vermiconidia calcicola TaxID=1690605 RepID=A0ACC3NZP4_9PEZI|nr:hypothetical protein LTR37_000380 [Vermiconidia calcicola]